MLTKSDIRQVHKELRSEDDSDLWPINGRFNVSDRAIRRAQRDDIAAYCDGPYEYRAWLDQICSEIVNDPRNW